ncbi:helix-turn-helix domain-containing protein [Kaistia defluvii]|uniref:helix-turn-helix domain-containing protein n=1 Tax=Kaistia defluvii TaxID=410841 RepID=UPI0022570F1E|nr:helix-turn-helix domain-containing protein [Kaistia defluvii]MCX5518463.1 helix-turn-helix domain-containing protein [Kaistia defluvii]
MSGPRYSIIHGDAATDPRLKGKALQVLCILGRHTDRGGWCSRSQVKMAAQLQCARSTIQAAISILVECGYVQQQERFHPNNGKRSHEYRVLLDDKRPAEFINSVNDLDEDSDDDLTDAAHPHAGLPASPMPTQNRHRDAGPEPASIRTTPSNNDLERDARSPLGSGSEIRRKLDAGAERAALAEAARADEAFMSQFRQWPKQDNDNIVRSHGSWQRLSEADRAAASAAVPVFIAKLRIDKAHCRFFTFIEERKWLDLAAKTGSVSASGTLLPIEPGTDLWWAIFWRRWKNGERVKFMFDQAFPIGAQPRQGVGVPAGAVPKPDEVSALVTIAVRDQAGAVTAEFRAWADRMSKDLVFRFNANDLHMPFIKVPSEWPPGRDGHRMAATGEEARQ